MKTLIIAEKPDMGRTIAAVLEPKARNKRTHLEGDRYIITWAIGHLVSLAEPDHYDPRYKKWKAEDLPIIPDKFKLWPNPRTKDQLKVIGELAKGCSELVNACDAGREGQLIFHLIRQHLKLRQPVQRLWISDLTPETIRRGFESLRSDTEYDPLTRAAKARSEADWLIGMNASRAFTIKHRNLLSVGRVQTPVLALLYDRHREIQAFQSETYYTVHAVFKQDKLSYNGLWQGERITSPEQAEALTAKVKGKPGEILSYEVKESKEYPYRLHDLTLLQREANGRYGFSAKKTLDIAQGLYEKHKVITYPRTNSNYVTEENLPVMANVLKMLGTTGEYGELAAGADRGRVHKGNRAVCNPSKVEDHHAILPTPKKAGQLSADEQKIYDLIVRRFLSHYYPPAVYNNHEVMTKVEEELFRTKVKQQLEAGWKVVQQSQENAETSGKSKRRKPAKDDEEQEEELVTEEFRVDKDKPVQCAKAEAREKATQPPKSYTEGTLLKAMETAGKAMEDEELKEAMKDTGLGTPATRAATIERLKQVGYITLSGKKLDITVKGCSAIELIRGAGVELLASPEMTGRWEQRLHQISKDEASDVQFMEKVKEFAAMIVAKVSCQHPAPPSMFEGAEQGAGGGRSKRGQSRSKVAAGRSSARTRTTGQSTAASGSASRVAHAAATKPAGGGLTALAPCPRRGCKGQLIEGKRGFGCTQYREGCTFVIWKEQQGKKISPAMIKSLVQKGETGKLTFKQQSGETRKGKLVLTNPESGAISIRLE
ncbi:DNA topoisomerase 3 [Paenibacillus sp. 1P07SE]|uniref:type IA DNA topoisomerase n=1 Tax=Paenibacillus sp. 1P07SE TaxID=3132209 RepID=UPI0039A4D579